MQSPQAKLKEISRILALWPSQAADDGDELLRAYLLAADDYPTDDVTAAVDTLVKGIAPGVNPSFRPKPSEFGAECRRQLNLRLDQENRARRLRPALPAPLIEHSPEDRAKVAELVQGLVERTAEQKRIETETSPKSNIWAKTNARFMPDLTDEAVQKRLGFTAGDPDAEADAA